MFLASNPFATVLDQVTFTSEGFYNIPDVKEALHAPDDHFWHGCQWGEGRRRHLMEKHRQLYMDNDKPLSMAPYIGELLDAGIPLLVYNGDRDMTTNMVRMKSEDLDARDSVDHSIHLTNLCRLLFNFLARLYRWAVKLC
jgi:hypothetical protein